MSVNLNTINSGKGAILSASELESFAASFQGRICTAKDENYDSNRQLWNKMIDKSPGVIATCSGVSDVIQAVNFARKNNLLVAIRGGGHSVAGYGMCDGGMVIDLSEMNAIWVDPKNKTAKVQGGATWLDVDRETQAFGLACAGGVVSDTGVGGLTLNGGLSWIRRKVGMSIDNLIGANLVLADGSYVYASETENSDLFWAIRGGGGNFGIVTSFDFKLHKLGPEVMFVACMYRRADAAKVMEAWVNFTQTAPDEISSDCIQWFVPAHPAFPEELHNEAITVVAGMYSGPAEEGQKALQALREIATPLLDMSGIYPYQGVQQMFDPFLPKQAFQSYWKSIYVDGLPEARRSKIINWASSIPAKSSLISIRHLGGAIGKVAEKATAFGDRSGKFLVSIDTMWEDEKDNEKCIQWTRDFFADIQKESKGQVYFNFNYDLVSSGDILADSYGGNYARLVEIKTKYDPHNFFSVNANIKPQPAAV